MIFSLGKLIEELPFEDSTVRIECSHCGLRIVDANVMPDEKWEILKSCRSDTLKNGLTFKQYNELKTQIIAYLKDN